MTEPNNFIYVEMAFIIRETKEISFALFDYIALNKDFVPEQVQTDDPPQNNYRPTKVRRKYKQNHIQ